MCTSLFEHLLDWYAFCRSFKIKGGSLYKASSVMSSVTKSKCRFAELRPYLTDEWVNLKGERNNLKEDNRNGKVSDIACSSLLQS